MIWKPAKTANIPTAIVEAPVGHLDLASTFCAIAGIDEPAYCEGQPLPVSQQQALEQQRSHVITEWDSEHGPVDMHLKSIYERSGWLCTAYQASHLYQGTEGELYNMTDDPDQLVNLWDDPSSQSKKSELLALLESSLPPERQPRLERKAPV